MNKENKVYITFPTHPMTNALLTTIAHKMGKTQPQLLNEICESYIVSILEELEDKGLLNLDDNE